MSSYKDFNKESCSPEYAHHLECGAAERKRKQAPLWLRQRKLPDVRTPFHFIHSYPELAFGKPKRDFRPALQKTR